jgi:hypothetical protein
MVMLPVGIVSCPAGLTLFVGEIFARTDSRRNID